MAKALWLRGGTAAAALLLAGLYANEGGFVDHKDDRGGATNHGATERVAREKGWTGSMRALPKHCLRVVDVCADRIHIEGYLIAPGFEPLLESDFAVTSELFDSAVLHGSSQPSRWFQQSLNEHSGARLTVDGVVGPRTIAAWRAMQAAQGKSTSCRTMLDSLDARQRAYFDAIVRNRPSQRVFYRGWINKRIGNVPRAWCERPPV